MILLLMLSFASIFNLSYGCQMEGVIFWQIPIPIQIKDIDEGVIFTKSVSDIQGVEDSRYGEATLAGPYFDIDIENNIFTITTNESYRRYEHNEVSANMDLTVEFACVGGGQESLLFLIQVQDTNNNDPEFIPSEVYEFVIAPPLPPNFVLTGCGRDIIARDIDLTTQRIQFGIEENDYFEIEYDEEHSTVAKEFKAILRTTSLIRNLREPIELRISATDVDLTGDDPRTTFGTLRVSASTDFDLPDDLLFSQTFYLANYTVDGQLNLAENILLKQGYDEQVKYELESDGFENNFELVPSDDQLAIVVTTPLPLEVISGNQIYLVVRADREYTSGATATIVIQLPEVPELSFELPLYHGRIENGTLEVPLLELSQGYEDNNVTAQVVGEYSTYFTADVQDNFVTLTMHGLPDEIISNNNFISLEVEASSIVSKSTTIVSLDIIKDDNVTPVFDKSIYTGTYDPVAGLTVEQMEFVQGFDDTVDIELFGEHKDLFTLNRGSITTITASDIPEELFVEHNIVLWIEARKERTVGANAAIIIALPTVEDITLVFEQNSYIGSITNENTNIPTIVLIEGYSENVNFSLLGDLSNYFRINSEQEVVTVSLPEPIPEASVPENKIIVLNIRAIAPEVTPVYTTVVIDYAIHEEEPVPSFNKVLFEGNLQNDTVSHESISLIGFTGPEVELLGEYASSFEAQLANNIVTVIGRAPVTVPTDVTHVALELAAGTARAVLVLDVHTTESPAEPEASFDKVLFEGDLRNGVVSHETITLSGYNGETVDLVGEHAILFEAHWANGIVTVIGREPTITLPSDLTHLALEMVAGSARAVLLITVHSTELPPEPDVSFDKVVFEGTLQNGVVSHETITLTGFTGTNIELFGEFASLFEAQIANNIVTITGRESPITLPSEFAHITLELVAGSARAVLVLSIHNTEGPIVPDVSFNKVVFEGTLQDGIVTHEIITLSGFTGTNVNLFGEYASSFEAQLANNIVTVIGRAPVTLPTDVTHVALELAAGTARAALVLDVHTTESPAEPEASFDKVLFEGDLRNGVVSHETITLSGYNGETVDLVGEHAMLFEAHWANGIVTVIGREPTITLPSDLTHLALEMVAGSARAVLLITVHSTELPPEPDVSFDKVVFEGTLQNGVVSHETITLTGFTGTNIELFGEFASLFEAQIANNIVTITGRESPITLPSEFAHITLELVAGSARAVLVLSIHNTEGPIVPDVSFNKVVFEGTLQDGIVTHEIITLSGFTGTNVNLFGEYASSFEAQLANNIVTVIGRAPVTLPTDVTHVALELAAGTARAVLVLDVHTTESPAEPEASFDKVLFEGDLRNGVVSHETITLSGYNGETVDLVGEHAILFEAHWANGIVTVIGREPTITLLSDLTHFALEMVAGSARAVLLITVHSTELPPEPDVSFDKVVFEGTLQNGVVSHETITLTGFTGTNIELFGEFASLFEAQIANNIVTITGRESPITLPSEFAHITLELVAGSARAVLVLSIHNTEGPIVPDVSFNKVVFEGTLQDGIVTHEIITLSGFTGTNVNLFGEYASSFEAQLANNIVTVIGRAPVTLPTDVTHVALELAAGTARAVLVLDVHTTESPAEPEASFDKVLFEGDLRNGVVSHETITLSGYNGETVDLVGEHAMLFEAHWANGIVTVIGREPTITLLSDLTHFALEMVAGSARAVLLITVHSTELPPEPDVSFDKVVFEGTLQNGVVSHETITLTGFTGTNIELFGEFASLFEAQIANNILTITGRESPITLPSEFAHITLELVAGSARAVLVLSIHNTEGAIVPDVSFNKVVFEGTLQDGIVTHEIITLSGFTGTNVNLFGEYASSFEAQLANNIVTVIGRAPVTLSTDVTHVALELAAGTARAVLVLDVHTTESPAEPEASFDKVLFEGDLRNGVVSHETITLSGYNGETVDLVGEHAMLFEAHWANGIVTVIGREPTITLLSDLTHFALEMVAGSARAVLLITVHSTELPPEPDVSFDKVVFEGTLQNGVVSHETITLTGFTGTNIELFGEFASLFEAQIANNILTITGRESPITLPSEFAHITLELVAGSARAVLVLSIHNTEGAIVPDVSFNKVVFEGTLQDGIVTHEIITLSGFTGTNVNLFGEYASSFEAQLANNIVMVIGRAPVTVPTDVTHVALELAAGTARAVLVLDVHTTESPAEPEASFDKVLFEGDLRNGVVSHETITLSGYNGETVDLVGEHAILFEVHLANGIVTVTGREPTITLPSDLTHLALKMVAGSARAVLLMTVHNTVTPSEASFTKGLYEGYLLNGIVVHEIISLSGYTGTNVEVVGEYASLFEAQFVSNIVLVSEKPPVTLPADVTHVALEIAAGTARAVLVLTVRNTESPPDLPIVTFSAQSYALRVDITQTGIIGQVVATADNGETINYSLQLNNSHLEERLSINNEGELRLSAPVSGGGFYAFQVEGTTVFSQARGTATVYLSVETVTVCGDELAMPPLIVIDHDEEEPYNNLLETEREGCHFELTNRWPLNQNWLYVDEYGLHTTAIDREHESIAFMPVSQIQVEITLICDTDSSRIKRSLPSDLGPYDYGLNKWILTDTILYNSRKSLVNLIVNDINDNVPIFVNKDSEPIAVGYPIPELQQFVLPTALAQLHATDADIGENAAIVYWSENPELAVAPLTGFVHIRDEANLEHDAQMTVHATDRNGEGHTGSIDVIVKLLDENNIAIVTVNDAFLDDEIDIVSYLSGAVGYDVKVLRSIVVPRDDLQEEVDGTRTKREVTRASGASLQLFVYGIEQREPVSVDRLTADINNSASETVNVADIVSLEDHLASLEICTARDTGLLVATIVLAVLLFIVSLLIALWFFLRWRRTNYNQFTDENSIASQNESMGQAPKPEVLPRLNIEELKKSERRLQEMLETPIEEVKVETTPAVNTDLIEISSKPNSPIINSPIVIQSIDKLKDVEESSDDEFGEVKLPRRKSVVTFNENVEKIIHVEDNDSEDLESVTDTEVYKF